MSSFAAIEERFGALESYRQCPAFWSAVPELAVPLGEPPRTGEGLVRQTGLGQAGKVTYHLHASPDQPMKLMLTLADDGTGRPGTVRIAEQTHSFAPGPFEGLRDMTFTVAQRASASLPVAVWSTTPKPCRVTAIQLLERK